MENMIAWFKRDWSGRSMREPMSFYEEFIDWSLHVCSGLIGCIFTFVFLNGVAV